MYRKVLIIPFVFLLCACYENNAEKTQKEILFSAGVSGTAFDEAGLFAEMKSENGSVSVLLSNERFVNSNGSLVSDKVFVIPEDASELSVCAYMPYDASLTDTGKYPFSLVVDQSSEDSFNNSDFLVANAVADAGAPVSLEFIHIPAEIVLETDIRGGELTDTEISASFMELPCSSEINLENAEVAVDGYSDIKAYIGNRSGSHFSASVRVFPCTLEKGRILSEISIGDDVYGIQVPEDMEIISGNRYILKVTIVGEGAEADAGFTIEDWNAGETIETEPDIDNGQLSVTDVDGNRYQVARFGENLWMLKNLRVRNYNDGTPVTYINDENPDVWNALTEGAFCCYNNAEPSSDNDHFLYNFYAIETGKLCPEGWHVPTLEEWTSLADLFGGADGCGAALKSTYGWDEDGNGTNASGMNILPVGSMDGWFKYNGKFAYLWTSSYKEDDNTKAHAVYLSYNNDALKHWSFGSSKIRGYAVRCIKPATETDK